MKRKFKNKQELIACINHLVGIELPNTDCTFNRKRRVLYTEITFEQRYRVLPLLHEFGLNYEKHMGDAYWICIN